MENFILKSEYEELKPIAIQTLPEYYLSKAKFFADQGRDFWLVEGLTDEKRYFNKFDEETRQIGSYFWKLGLRKGDTVIYMVRDLCKLHILLIGVLRSNGVMRASYPDDDAETIILRVKESKCKFIVCEEDAIQRCREVAGKISWDVEIITVNRVDSTLSSLQQILEEEDGTKCPEIAVSENDPAIIMCTSGTTGMPKGAVLTHGCLLNQTRNLERIGYMEKKPNFVASKATHVTGTILALTIMSTGKTAIALSNLTKANILNTVAKFKPGFAFAFPTFLIAMADEHEKGYRDFSCIERIFTAGAVITPAITQTLKKLPNLADIIIIYGMTEAFLCATNAVLKELSDDEPASIRDIPGFSVGKPGPLVDLQIRHPDTMTVLGPNEQGEIFMKSPGLFHSYYLNPEATKKAFEDGYYRTGDVGYYDKNGFVYVVDRLKEIFKYYNDHISPSELESVIAKHPKVSEVCVVGVADAGGHVPRAFVTLQPNLGEDKQIAEEIQEYANGKLPTYKHIRGGVYVIKELPKGNTGKISRQLVQKLHV